MCTIGTFASCAIILCIFPFITDSELVTLFQPYCKCYNNSISIIPFTHKLSNDYNIIKSEEIIWRQQAVVPYFWTNAAHKMFIAVIPARNCFYLTIRTCSSTSLSCFTSANTRYKLATGLINSSNNYQLLFAVTFRLQFLKSP
jgi:hypothetical protein